MASDDFIVRGIDFCSGRDELLYFAFIVKPRLGPNRCHLIFMEFASDDVELDKVRE